MKPDVIMEWGYWRSRLACTALGHRWVRSGSREICDRAACRGRTTRPGRAT